MGWRIRVALGVVGLAVGIVLAGTLPGTAANDPKTPATRPAATRAATGSAPATTRSARTPAAMRPVVAAASTRAASTATPRTIKELKEIQDRVEAVVKDVTPATVGVMMGSAQGSGVIVSADGYVLTAGHVAATPGQDCTLVLADGRKVRARTLGVNSAADAGLIKITEGGAYPHVDVAPSSDLKQGQWVVALGHPGGYHKDRPPVVRLGRVLFASEGVLATDCTLIGGDSGGPLVDLDGHVVGIHSRIGPSTTANIHVGLDAFLTTWDRLARGEAWGGVRRGGGMLGLVGGDDEKGCVVEQVWTGTPADKAGLKVGDVIMKVDGQPVAGIESLTDLLSRHRPGDQVKLDVWRGEKAIEIKATLMARR